MNGLGQTVNVRGSPFKAFACAACGTLGGAITGLVTSASPHTPRHQRGSSRTCADQERLCTFLALRWTTCLGQLWTTCERKGSPFKAFVCAACGTPGGAIIGLDTEYLASHSWAPARELSTTRSQSGCEQTAGLRWTTEPEGPRFCTRIGHCRAVQPVRRMALLLL